MATNPEKYHEEVQKEKARVEALLRPFLRDGVVVEVDNILAGDGFVLRFDGKSVGVAPVGDDHTYLAIGETT